MDEEKLLPGQDWDLEIEKAVEAADAVIVFLSNNSVTKEGYVQRELRFVLRIADIKPEGTVFVIPLVLAPKFSISNFSSTQNSHSLIAQTSEFFKNSEVYTSNFHSKIS